MRTIALIAHFSGDAGTQKLRYLERVDAALRSQGYRLLLIDQTGAALQTSCDFVRYHEVVNAGELVAQARSLQGTPQAAAAIAVDAGHDGRAPDQIANELLTSALQIYASVQKESIELAVLWHQFNGMSMLLRHLFEEDGVPVVYAHLGALPGTICFEPDGQMAESWVCTRSDEFSVLPVGPEDMAAARRYLDHVQRSKLDRKVQPDAEAARRAIKQLRERAARIVFYAGQNDFRAGMQPRSLATARIHSPYFEDTHDGLQALADAARARDSQIVFKPHPNVRTAERGLPDGVAMVRSANVFECITGTEVTATIVSATAYLALIHGRPVVLMGRMPLAGKGCTYEISSRNALTDVLGKALELGLTDAQTTSFHRHTAQLIRYSLFAFEPDIESLVGRGTSEAAALLVAAANRRLRLPDPKSVATVR